MTDHRQLFEINFWGVYYGSTTAVKHLKQRGGAIINLGSVASDLAFPVQGMYATSKFAIKGFTDAFRRELHNERRRFPSPSSNLRASRRPSQSTPRTMGRMKPSRPRCTGRGCRERSSTPRNTLAAISTWAVQVC